MATTTMADEAFWTPDVKRVLVALIQQNPILWDIRCDEYKEPQLKPAVWNHIAMSLGSTPALVEAKWHNLRSSYVRYKRAVREGNRNPKRYRFASDMSFLDEIDGSKQDSSVISDEDGDDDDPLLDLNGAKTAESSWSLDDKTAWSFPPSAPPSKRKRYSDRLPTNNSNIPALEVPESLLNFDRYNPKPLASTDLFSERWNDPDFLYCMVLYHRLRAISQSHAKEMMKLDIEKRLLDMQYGPANTGNSGGESSGREPEAVVLGKRERRGD